MAFAKERAAKEATAKEATATQAAAKERAAKEAGRSRSTRSESAKPTTAFSVGEVRNAIRELYMKAYQMEYKYAEALALEVLMKEPVEMSKTSKEILLPKTTLMS